MFYTNACFYMVYSKQSFRSRPLDVKAPANYAGAQQSYGVDYTKGRPSRPQNSGPMLNRVQESLSNTLLEPGAHQGEEEYDYKPVSELSSMFKPAGRTPTHHRKCALLLAYIECCRVYNTCRLSKLCSIL